MGLVPAAMKHLYVESQLRQGNTLMHAFMHPLEMKWSRRCWLISVFQCLHIAIKLSQTTFLHHDNGATTRRVCRDRLCFSAPRVTSKVTFTGASTDLSWESQLVYVAWIFCQVSSVSSGVLETGPNAELYHLLLISTCGALTRVVTLSPFANGCRKKQNKSGVNVRIPLHNQLWEEGDRWCEQTGRLLCSASGKHTHLLLL